jgi:hypothetical protein
VNFGAARTVRWGARFAAVVLTIGFALTVTPVSAAVLAATDREVASAGVLQLSDFPTGWSRSPRAEADDPLLDKTAAKIKACKPFLAFTKANRTHPRKRSPNFDESQARVSNAVTVFPSTAKAVGAMRTFSHTRVPSCLEQVDSAAFEAELADDEEAAKELRSVRANIVPVEGVTIGDEAVVYEGRMRVAWRDGTSETVGLGVVAVRVDDAIAGYSYTSDSDISAVLQPAIVSSIERLEDAQAVV